MWSLQCLRGQDASLILWEAWAQAGTAHFSQETAKVGSTRASSSKAPSFHLYIQAHHHPKSLSHGFYTEDWSLQPMLCLMQSPNFLQAARGNSAQLSLSWLLVLLHLVLLGGTATVPFRGSQGWLFPHHTSVPSIKWSPWTVTTPHERIIVTLVFSIKLWLYRGSSSEANEWLLKEVIFCQLLAVVVLPLILRLRAWVW